MKNEQKTQRTLVFCVRGNQICLAQKKRGFGAGYLNGYGGKQYPSETIEQTAVRELHEESGISVSEGSLQFRGIGHFTFTDKPEWDQDVYMYLIELSGDQDPVETEEMKPEWFLLSDIPYKNMWPGDDLWTPQILTNTESLVEFDLEMTSQHEIVYFGFQNREFSEGRTMC